MVQKVPTRTVVGADMKQIVAHRIGAGIEEVGDLLFRFALHAVQHLKKKLNIISTAGFEDLLFGGRSLYPLAAAKPYTGTLMAHVDFRHPWSSDSNS